MAEPTPPKVREVMSGRGAARAGLSRRQLVRAGLSAGTVATTLKSHTVLAASGTVCIMASAFSSLDVNPLTSQVLTQVPGACLTASYWDGQLSGSGGVTAQVTAFSSIISISKNTSVSSLGFTARYPGLTQSDWNKVNVGGSRGALTYSGGNSNYDQLLHSTVAAYLTAASLNDVDVVLTRAQCVTIWNNAGVWTAPGGLNLDLGKTLRYFAKIGVV